MTLILFLRALVPAAPKNRDWQTGPLLDSEHNTYFARGYSNSDNSTVPPVDSMNESVNMPVKFAVEKKKLWLLDDDGQELMTNIAKRKPKFPPTRKFQATQ